LHNRPGASRAALKCSIVTSQLRAPRIFPADRLDKLGLKRIFTRRSDARRLALLGIVTGSLVAASAAAQETGGPTPQQLARDRENPFAQTINLPLAAVTGFGIGPHHDVGEQLTIQPQLPLPFIADWNLIVRSLLPVTFSPDPQRRFGLGDVQPSFFLTPASSTGLIWGAGPAFQFPTATNNELGTGKWSAGPTGALVYSDSEGPWFAGILVAQLWSFAGAPRAAVNQTSTEIDLSYNFDSGWYIQTDPTITYDWSAAPRQALTLPVGIDVGKVTKIGGQDVSFQLGAYDALKSPAGTAQWIIRAQITLLFPR
jgi:hypothetical protein